jgi:hypothetical protein
MADDGEQNRTCDERLGRVLASYFRRVDSGELVDREQLIGSHPDLAEELRAFFADERELGVVADSRATLRSSPGTQHTGLLRVRCPHCRTPFDVSSDAPLADVSCSACGNRFGLVDDVSVLEESARHVAHFELVERIGAGSFGTVWKALDTELDRTVAVKIPRRGLLPRSETDQLLREARASAQLRHPNIVSVHEVGRDGEIMYIVSDYVCGMSLADWLAEQLRSPKEAATLCAKIARALDHAHEGGRHSSRSETAEHSDRPQWRALRYRLRPGAS